MVRAFKDMHIHEGTIEVPQPSMDGTSLPSFRHPIPLPPTPPRPSQRRLDEEEAISCWGNDSNSVDGNADDTATNEQIRNEEAAASSPMDGDGLSKAVVDNRTREDSPAQNRVRTQEERAALEHMIFGDEDEELDEAFWEADGALQMAVAHPGKYEGASATEEQERESEESEGEASKSDGLFGATSTTFPSTTSEPRSHQDERDRNAANVQGIPEVAADSASVDTLASVENASPTPATSTPTTSTLLTLPEPARTTFDPSSPTNYPTSPEAPTGIGANEDRPDPVSVPITPVNPNAKELEPFKPVVVARSAGAPQCNTMRRIIRKMGLPGFTQTRSSIFSIPAVTSSDDGSLGKRKRSREDDRDDGLPVVLPR